LGHQAPATLIQLSTAPTAAVLAVEQILIHAQGRGLESGGEFLSIPAYWLVISWVERLLGLIEQNSSKQKVIWPWNSHRAIPNPKYETSYIQVHGYCDRSSVVYCISKVRNRPAV
jgi:hypothetical protein